MLLSRALLRRHSVLPGFDLALGFTLLYLSLIVLVPLAAAFLKTATMTWPAFWSAVSSERVVASYRLTFGASFLAAVVNAVFGLLVCWVLVRYEFAGRRFVDALVDLPFALPTGVAGIALTALYSGIGWIGRWLPFKVSFTPVGVWVALTFIGLPFVVRTLQPVLEDLQKEVEEASAILGASRWQTFTRVILPILTPALLTGPAFARALGSDLHRQPPMISLSSPSSSSTTTPARHDRGGDADLVRVLLAINGLRPGPAQAGTMSTPEALAAARRRRRDSRPGYGAA
jgi:sulfate transport system permease protein